MENLQDKAISIKGKQYILVKDRVVAFNDSYTNGSIITELVENGEQVTVKATVTPDVDKPTRIFTGYSQARWDDKTSMVNKSSALENAETSAVGRALAMMGIGVIESLASADEINKAASAAPRIKKTYADTETSTAFSRVSKAVETMDKVQLEDGLKKLQTDPNPDLSKEEVKQLIYQIEVKLGIDPELHF